MSLEQRDLETIERIVFKASDDVAVSIARGFERLEERIDGAESRVYGRLVEVEDSLLANHDGLGDLESAVRELTRAHDEAELEGNHPSNHN